MILKSAFLVFALISNQAYGVTTQQTLSERNNETWIKVNVDLDQQQLDVLFVVDNSGSMMEHQQQLAAAAPGVVQKLKGYQDVNTAIITTSVVDPKWFPNAAAGSGKFTAPVVNTTEADFRATLSQNIIVGTDGDAAEKPLDAVALALSEPLLSNENKGFLRPQADLLLIFLTDTDDQSSVDLLALQTQLTNLKPNKNIFVVAALPADVKTCMAEPEFSNGTRLKDFLALMNGNAFDLCSADFAGDFSKALPTAVSGVGPSEVALFSNGAGVDVSSVTVKAGTLEIPFGDVYAGWVYDSKNQKILLGQGVNYGSAKSLTVEYKLK